MASNTSPPLVGIPLSPVLVQSLGGAQAVKQRADRVYRTTLARLVKESTTLTDAEKIQLLHDMVCQPPEAAVIVEEAPKTGRYLSPDGTQEMDLKVTSELPAPDSDVEDE